jgi:hypothetical protein
MSNKTINQHYIPKCVLYNFSNKKQQLYECYLIKKKIYKTNIKSSMMDRYTYEHPYIEINRIERWFSVIENKIGPLIRRIIMILENNGYAELRSIIDVLNICLPEFLIFYYRSGALLYEYSFDQNDENNRILIMSEKIMNSGYIKSLSKSIIGNYNICIVNSVNGNFLLSDQFLSTAALSIKNRFASISNRHMGLKDTIILIPISKKYYAVYYHGNVPRYITSNRINILNEMQVNEINKVIINNSYRKCISYSNEALVSALEKFEDQSPSEIYAGYGDKLLYAATRKKEVFFYDRDKKAWQFIETPNWDRYYNIGRNDICPCGSNIKYKKCCLEPLSIAEAIISPFMAKREFPFATVDVNKDAISADSTIELPIDQFIG